MTGIVLASAAALILFNGFDQHCGTNSSGFTNPSSSIPVTSGLDGAVGTAAAAFAADRLRKKLSKTGGNRGAIYARFSTKFQHSTEDQVRTCMAWAERNGVHVDKKHIYIDEGVSGKTQDRPGLNAMLAALAANEVDVVVVFMTSRLFRKMYKALEFVDVKIVAKRKRCMFVQQGIDTNDTELWKPLLQVWAMLDERQIAMLKSYVNAAHEGLLLKNWVHSTITFGYQGKPVDGPPTKTGKPRKEWAIDPVAAEWVIKIYRWFLGMEPGVRALGDKAIARKLNRLRAPLPPKVKGGRWTAQAVRLVLQNRRYVRLREKRSKRRNEISS